MRVVHRATPVAAQEAACRMNRDQHRDNAERLLADPAGTTQALHYDVYNPTQTVTTSGDTQQS